MAVIATPATKYIQAKVSIAGRSLPTDPPRELLADYSQSIVRRCLQRHNLKYASQSNLTYGMIEHSATSC